MTPRVSEIVERYPDPDPNCLCCEGGKRLPKRLHKTNLSADEECPIYVCAECQALRALEAKRGTQ